MKQNSIDILIAIISGHDSTGRDIKTWPVNYTTTGSFQPLKYNANYKPYGITDKTSDVVYSKEAELIRRYNLPITDPNQFNATCRIGFNGKQYRIDSILPYPNHIEVYLELVI